MIWGKYQMIVTYLRWVLYILEGHLDLLLWSTPSLFLHEASKLRDVDL